MLDAAGQRVAGQADGGDAEHGAGQVERVVGQVLGTVGRYAEPDADAGDQRDRGVDDQQPLPAARGPARCRRAAGPRTKPDMPTTIITVMARMRSALSSKSRKTSELVIGAIAAAAMPRAARRAISSPACVTHDDAQAEQPEDGEADQQHASAAEPVGHRAGGEQQAAEGQRVGAGDPLQRGGAAAEVAADGRQRDRQQGVVDHLDEEGQTERGQRDPGRAQRRVGARGGRKGRDRGHGETVGGCAFVPVSRRLHQPWARTARPCCSSPATTTWTSTVTLRRSGRRGSSRRCTTR